MDVKPKKQSKLKPIIWGGSRGFFIGLILSSCLFGMIPSLEAKASEDSYFFIAVMWVSIICCIVTGSIIAVESRKQL